MPQLIIEHPLNLTSEGCICWLHFPVCIKSRFWQLGRLDNCMIFLLLDVAHEEIQLLWCKQRETVEPNNTVTLQDGDDPWLVPTIARLDIVADRWLCGTPGRLPYFRLDPYIPLITDINVMRWRFNRINLLPGEHQIQFRVKAGNNKIDSQVFKLNIPPGNQSNETFGIK